jgi:hypothetical protein
VKRLLALLALAVAGVVAAGVFAITKSHDTAPADVEACAVDQGAHLALGEEGLELAREDIRAGTLRVERRYRLHDDRAVLLRGSGYRVLVISAPEDASLEVPDLPFRVYRQTSTFTKVLTERDPVRGVLDGCVRRAAA